MNLRELLDSRDGIILADGAMGTVLAERTPSGRGTPEEINLSDPAAVTAVHRDYISAGSEIITTNTFGAGARKLAKSGLAEKAAEINAAGVEAALRARRETGARVLVAGSLGPSGELPPPLGEVSADELARNFRDQARVLVESGADLLLVETMSSAAEARLAVESAREAAGKTPLVLSFSFSAGKRGPRNLMGESPAEIASLFREWVDCLGANCGEGPAEMLEAVRLLAGPGRPPAWVKPNAGRPRLENGKTLFPLGPGEFASFLPSLASAGARIVGGCCGTTPEFIAALARETGAGR